MSLEKVSTILKIADNNRFAALAVDVYDYQSAFCVVKAAEQEKLPVILMFYPDMSNYIPMSTIAAIAVDTAKKAAVPVGVHLDHSRDLGIALNGLASGFPSVMIDGSALPFEENISLTKQVADLAHNLGVDVEAELGLVGFGSNIKDFIHTENYTTCKEAKEFVERTKADSLAVAIGNSHGHYVCEPHLDFKRLDEINKTIDTALVLHGGSGIPKDQMTESVKYGINKVNVGTEFFEKCKEANAKYLNREKFILEGYKAANEEIIDFVQSRIRIINPYQYSL